MSEKKARALRRESGQRIAHQKLALEEQVKHLEQAVNHNAEYAETFRKVYVELSWCYFWQQVAMAALCAYVEKYGQPGAFTELEKATYFWPAEVKI